MTCSQDTLPCTPGACAFWSPVSVLVSFRAARDSRPEPCADAHFPRLRPAIPPRESALGGRDSGTAKPTHEGADTVPKTPERGP